MSMAKQSSAKNKLEKGQSSASASDIGNPQEESGLLERGSVTGSAVGEIMQHGELPSRGLNGPSPSEISHLQQGHPKANKQSHIDGNGVSGTSPLQDRIVVAMDVNISAPTMLPVEEDINAIVLDPKNSARQYARDPFTGLQREIWRPGDGDGDKGTDYYERTGPPVPLEQRWRLYQLPTGNGPIRRSVNEPPKYVMLDDRAAYECLASDIHRKTLSVNWPHDFGGAGKIRSRRPHRGRAAIGDADAKGDDKYHFGKVGVKNERYYFIGEKDYKPIIYRDPDEPSMVTSTPPAEAQNHTATSSAPGRPKPMRKRGHNQHTHPDLLVKNGAPALRQRQQGLPRLNHFLHRDPTPTTPFEKAKRVASRFTYANVAALDQDDDEVLSILKQDDGEGMFISPDTPNRGQRETTTADKPIGTISSDMEHFPFLSRSTSVVASATPGVKSTEPPRKKQALQHHVYSRQTSEQATAENGDNGYGATDEAPRFDYRSYASQLEEQLSKARQTIEEQGDEIDLLKKAHRAGQKAIVALRSEVTALRNAHEEEGQSNGDENDAEDEYEDELDDEDDSD